MIDEAKKRGDDVGLILAPVLSIIRNTGKSGLRLSDNDAAVQRAGDKTAQLVIDKLNGGQRRSSLDKWLLDHYPRGVPTHQSGDDAWYSVGDRWLWTQRLRKLLTSSLLDAARALGNYEMGRRYVDRLSRQRDIDRDRAMQHTHLVGGGEVASLFDIAQKSLNNITSEASAAEYFHMRSGAFDFFTHDLGSVMFHFTISPACASEIPTYGANINPGWSKRTAKEVMIDIDRRVAAIRDCCRKAGVPLPGDVHIEEGRGRTKGLPHLHGMVQLRNVADARYLHATFKRWFPGKAEYVGGVVTGGKAGKNRVLNYTGKSRYARNQNGQCLRTAMGGYLKSRHMKFCNDHGIQQYRPWGQPPKKDWQLWGALDPALLDDVDLDLRNKLPLHSLHVWGAARGFSLPDGRHGPVVPCKRDYRRYLQLVYDPDPSVDQGQGGGSWLLENIERASFQLVESDASLGRHIVVTDLAGVIQAHIPCHRAYWSVIESSGNPHEQGLSTITYSDTKAARKVVPGVPAPPPKKPYKVPLPLPKKHFSVAMPPTAHR